jgi:hypothetical protein
MTTRNHDLLTGELRATARQFLDSFAGVSPAQWSFKPAPDRWSIAETAEHVTAVELNVHQLLTSRLLNLPAAPEQRAEMKGKDMMITTRMFDRSERRAAPESVLPNGRWPDARSVVQAFAAARDGTIGWLEKIDVDLRGYCAPHPLLGLLDGKQWALFMAAHAERHARQILEVKSADGWPGGGK